MKRLFLIILLFESLLGYSQEKLALFIGNFDQALDSAKKTDKDIFLITKSYACHVFAKFEARLNNDQESIKYLNSNFIVYQYDMDEASKEEKRRMKKYYNSWLAFPQLYFIDKNEKQISDMNYPLPIEHSQQLEVWKSYKSIESDWKKIRSIKNRKTIDYNSLNEFLIYRQIKYSPFDLIQISNIIDKYFKNLDSTQYGEKQNWNLIQEYVTIHSNPDVFDLVAKHKIDFQKNNGDTIVSDYLLYNYQRKINWQKPEKVKKLAKKYPYNTIPEAQKAVELYWISKNIQSTIKVINN